MKVIRHFAAATTGRIDTDALCRRMTELHDEVEISEIITFNGAKAPLFRKIFNGTVTDGNIPASADLIVFPAGIIIFEICFHGESLPGEVMEKNFLKVKVSIREGEKELENPLYMHCWLFFFDLMRFSDIVSRISEVNIVDRLGQVEIQKRIAETSLINPWFLGNELLFETQADFGEQVLVMGAPKEVQGEELHVGDQRLIRAGHIWYSSADSQEVLDLCRFLSFQKNTLRICSFITGNWLELIGTESVRIRDRLGEKNKLYWSRLKGKLEEWDLNFLTFLTACTGQLNSLLLASLPKLSDNLAGQNSVELRRHVDAIRRDLDEIRYGLVNMRTPCEAHDEELLQRETEKGNERIMLLSFLAMSIPLLGAILAPGISLSTKLISAFLLILAPITYSIIRREHLQREQKKAHLSYLKSQKDVIMEGLERARRSIENISRNAKLSEKTRADTIAFVEKSMEASRKHLKQIEKEMDELT